MHELAHALKNPEPQAPFYNIGYSQMMLIEKLYYIFSKVADNLHQRVDPMKQQPVTKSAIIPHKMRPTMTKHIPLGQSNII